MKKLLSVIMSIWLATTCMCTFVGCDGADKSDGKENMPTVHTYYAYDVETEEYEDEDYITVTDTAAAWYSNDVGLNATIEFNGSVTYSGKKFTMTLNGAFSVLDTCVVTFRGECENDGVLRIDSTVFTTYSELTDKPVVITDNEVMYYCKKGSKPDNPVITIIPPNPPEVQYTITLNANGGTLASGVPATITTDTNGRINYNTIKAPSIRNGYVFKGYNVKADGTGTTVDGTTVFTKDTTIYAIWAREITVTFKDGDTVFDTKKIGSGDRLGDYRVPQADDKYFEGWFSNGIKYTSNTAVLNDITLTAQWLTDDDIVNYLHELTADSQEGHLYIHYRRADHDAGEVGTTNKSAAPTYNSPILSEVYGDWALWAWPKNGQGRTFNAARIDLFGAVYDIDLTYTYTDCGWDGVNGVPTDYQNKFDTATIGTQLFKLSSQHTQGFWANDGGNNYIDASYNHIFVTEGRVGYPVYINSFTGEFKNE